MSKSDDNIWLGLAVVVGFYLFATKRPGGGSSTPSYGPPQTLNPVTDPRCKPYPQPIPADISQRAILLAKTLEPNGYVKEPDPHHPGQNVFYHCEVWTTGDQRPNYKTVVPYLVDAPTEPATK